MGRNLSSQGITTADHPFNTVNITNGGKGFNPAVSVLESCCLTALFMFRIDAFAQIYCYFRIDFLGMAVIPFDLINHS